MENNANQLNSMLCKRNCGFFGNAAYDGYCSKCYKDHVKRQNTGSAAGRVTPTTGLTSNTTHTETHQEQPIVSTPVQEPIIQTPPTLTTQTSIPIPIPTKSTNINNNNNNDESTPMSIPSSSLLSTTASSSVCDDLSSSMNATGTTPTGSSVGSEKKKRNRCVLESCKRKVGLTGFDCRCGGLYCWEHRYSDKHNCKFDYKELGQDQIRKNNPIVVGEKIQKI